jgi:hypothetical protein
MKVKELIEKLKQFDPELPVAYGDNTQSDIFWAIREISAQDFAGQADQGSWTAYGQGRETIVLNTTSKSITAENRIVTVVCIE